ncbi:MAG: STAS domain-containing protein [Phycisphaerales bacterium]|nr:STAS domain-containing protein [Phycisphaerales bacterium]
MSILATPKASDDSFVSVAATTHVAVASIELPSVRERQAAIMQERLTDLAAQCHGRLAVGFTEVTDMTSAAINALVEVSGACRARGGSLVIFGLARPLRKVFASTGLDKLLTVAADADAALRLFNPRPRWSLFGRAA